MKVKFVVDSGANIYSKNDSGWLDPVKDLGLNVGEWESLTDDEKYKMAQDWAWNYLEIYYKEEPQESESS